VRANVCVLLGNVRPATGRERLAAVADGDPDLDVREKARWALGGWGGERTQPISSHDTKPCAESRSWNNTQAVNSVTCYHD